MMLRELEGSGFNLVRKYKGRFSLQGALQYFGIYDNCIFTTSGKVVLGFFVEFNDFNVNSNITEFIHSLDDELECTCQFYIVYSKSAVSVFFFITLPYPFENRFSFLKNMQFAFSQEYAKHHLKKKYMEISRSLESLRACVLSYLPHSSVLTDDGLNGFLNLIINKDKRKVRDIRSHIRGDYNFHFDHFTYDNEYNLILKLKNFPQENYFSDLLFGSCFDFPFILEISVTKPTRRASNLYYAEEFDFAEQVKTVTHANAGAFSWGDNINLTQSFGDYIYLYDCAAFFFSPDIEDLKKKTSAFQSRLRDFGLIFSQEQLYLINAASAFFPGLVYPFQEPIRIVNTDLKYLLPFSKKEYRILNKADESYPEFVPEAPPDLSEAQFKAVTIKETGEGPATAGVDDEEKFMTRPGDISTLDSFTIGSKKTKEQPRTTKSMDELLSEL